MNATVVATEVSELQIALQTANFELNYERSSRGVECVIKDEDIRKLKYQLLLLEDRNEELIEQLDKEEIHARNLEQDLEDALKRCEKLEIEVQRLNEELRVRLRESSTMRAELNAMSSVSSDSTKLLTEKLALSRELSTLKPELEHLRTQVSMNQQLLSEKLSLERQLNTVQVELENAQRAAQRSKERQRKTGDYDATYEAQLDELQKQLKDEKVARREVQRELERRKSSQAASRERPSSRGENDDNEHLKAEIEKLRKELSAEKLERQNVEKRFETENAAWKTHRSQLDDKLAQFRTKLRSTKEQLKEKAEELDKVKQNVSPKPAEPQKVMKKAANSRKRAAAQIEHDASNLGTPGDGIPAKRAMKAMATMPGEKSTFSITPFLNRTMSVPPESPGTDHEAQQPQIGQSRDDATATVEEDGQVTPSAPPKKASVNKPRGSKQPLAPAASAKANVNPQPRRKKSVAAAPALEKVAEESPEKDENIEPQKQSSTQPSIAAKLKANRPPRKSLLDFSTFSVEAATHIKKKQRTLGNSSFLGGNTTTLFDEDDDDRPAPKAIPGKGIWGGRTMAFGKGGFANAKNRLKGPLMTADDGSGFQFSPLKKDRRRIAEEARRVGETTVMG